LRRLVLSLDPSVMPLPLSARRRPDAGLGFARLGFAGFGAAAWLSACSLINHFDDVKPELTNAGGAGGDAQTTGSMGGAAGGAGMTGGSGGTSAGDGGSVMTGDSGVAGGSIANEAGPGDGGAEAAAPRVLACNEVTNARHRMDDYSANTVTQGRTLSDRFFAYPLVSGNTVRILVQHDGSPNSYLLYYATDQSSTGPFSVDNTNGRMLDVHKTSPTTSAAFVINVNDPAFGQRFAMQTYDDTTQGTTPTMEIALTARGELGTSGQVDATFSVDDKGKVGIVASFSLGASFRAGYGVFDLAVGSPVTLTKLFDDVNPDNTRPSTSFRIAQQGTYAFFGNFGVPTAQTEYDLSDGQMPKSRQILATQPVAGQSLYVLGGTSNSTGKLDIAEAKVDTNSGLLWLYMGQFNPTEAMTFTDAKLNLAKQAGGLGDIPFGSTPSFTGDNLIFVGPTGSARTDLAILAVDALGHVRIEQKLWSTTGKISNATIAPRGTVALIGGKYFIVWSETATDVNGGYDTLWYSEIECL
jgi:hypothetical protein